jgi:hypothetical protein
LALLSPILPNRQRSGLEVVGLSDKSLDYSSQEEADDNKSQFMERIDDWMQELERMDQEQTAFFDGDINPDDT